ncbi:hypothetical protein FSARC_3276 [Fusarium sarcochroum]|uniref:Uncharacterized protein n=1 Tax=Fusarium sarcochroum TaxID=1208366 RepID=A0A8H4U4P8_9HYPO|nr:hypothetical protein FSARC_3276 [Fusarium sarcochroum]
MDDFVQKSGHEAAIFVREFSSLHLCDGQLPPMELQFLHQAIEAIASGLEEDHGLSTAELEILAGYAARLNLTEQLPFPTAQTNALRFTRPASAVAKYDTEFLQFVFQILNRLTSSQGSNATANMAMPIVDTNPVQQTSNQFQNQVLPLEGTFLAPIGTSTRSETFTSSNVSETGSMFSTMTSSTSTSMSGSMAGSISMSTTSSMFTASSIPAGPNQFMSTNVNSWIEGLPEMPQVMGIDDAPFRGHVRPNWMEPLSEGSRLENLQSISLDELSDLTWYEEIL